MKLLLVEDNAELAHWIVNLLRGENFSVDFVLNGEQADSVLTTQRYDVVILDMRLPRMSGSSTIPATSYPSRSWWARRRPRARRCSSSCGCRSCFASV